MDEVIAKLPELSSSPTKKKKTLPPTKEENQTMVNDLRNNLNAIDAVIDDLHWAHYHPQGDSRVKETLEQMEQVHSDMEELVHRLGCYLAIDTPEEEESWAEEAHGITDEEAAAYQMKGKEEAMQKLKSMAEQIAQMLAPVPLQEKKVEVKEEEEEEDELVRKAMHGMALDSKEVKTVMMDERAERIHLHRETSGGSSSSPQLVEEINERYALPCVNAPGYCFCNKCDSTFAEEMKHVDWTKPRKVLNQETGEWEDFFPSQLDVAEEMAKVGKMVYDKEGRYVSAFTGLPLPTSMPLPRYRVYNRETDSKQETFNKPSDPYVSYDVMNEETGQWETIVPEKEEEEEEIIPRSRSRAVGHLTEVDQEEEEED